MAMAEYSVVVHNIPWTVVLLVVSMVIAACAFATGVVLLVALPWRKRVQ